MQKTNKNTKNKEYKKNANNKQKYNKNKQKNSSDLAFQLFQEMNIQITDLKNHSLSGHRTFDHAMFN